MKKEIARFCGRTGKSLAYLRELEELSLPEGTTATTSIELSITEVINKLNI